jgi:hypothetical protein
MITEVEKTFQTGKPQSQIEPIVFAAGDAGFCQTSSFGEIVERKTRRHWRRIIGLG